MNKKCFNCGREVEVLKKTKLELEILQKSILNKDTVIYNCNYCFNSYRVSKKENRDYMTQNKEAYHDLCVMLQKKPYELQGTYEEKLESTQKKVRQIKLRQAEAELREIKESKDESLIEEQTEKLEKIIEEYKNRSKPCKITLGDQREIYICELDGQNVYQEIKPTDLPKIKITN